MIVVRIVPALQISIDFTKSVRFESAPVSIFSRNLDPGRLIAPQDGPVSITAECRVDPMRRDECIELMRDARLIYSRNGAHRWHLYGDLNQPNIIRMEVVVPSWKQHLLQRERMTSLLLFRLSVRADPLEAEAWLKTRSNTVALALNLVPFAGIAFLWFIGVLRDRLGELEDRFFATVFLGSGLLFLAMLFASAPWRAESP